MLPEGDIAMLADAVAGAAELPALAALPIVPCTVGLDNPIEEMAQPRPELLPQVPPAYTSEKDSELQGHTNLRGSSCNRTASSG